MSDPIFSTPANSEWLIDLLKDGGRRVMYGGNAYEDDLEPASSPAEPSPEHPAPAGGTHSHHE